MTTSPASDSNTIASTTSDITASETTGDLTVEPTGDASATTGRIPAGSVVVGIDGSDEAIRALHWAADQAALEKRPLAVLHASPRQGMGVYPGAEYLMMDAASVAAFAEGARAVLSAAVDDVTVAHPDLRVVPVKSDVDPRSALLDASAHAHLVVVGSRGRGHVSSVLLGSVSAAVATRSTCPVVVVRPPTDEAHAPGVLVGVRFAPGSVAVVEHAFAYASQHELPLTVTHCYFDTEGYNEHPRRALDSRTDLDGEREQLAEAVAGLSEKYPDVSVDLDLTTGAFRQLLADAAATHDLVVVGRRSGSRLDRAIGTWSTMSIVENAAGVVAVVPESS